MLNTFRKYHPDQKIYSSIIKWNFNIFVEFLIHITQNSQHYHILHAKKMSHALHNL